MLCLSLFLCPIVAVLRWKASLSVSGVTERERRHNILKGANFVLLNIKQTIF